MTNRILGMSLIILAAALIAGGPGEAVADEVEWDLFLYGGAATSSFVGTDARLLGEESRTGFVGGGGLFLRFYDEMGIEFGIRYAQKGSRGTILVQYSVPNFKNVPVAVGNAEFDIDYIEFPLVFAGVLEIGARSWIRAYGGPSINVLIKAHVTGTANGEPVDQDIDDVLRDVDYTGVVGATYKYGLSSFSLIADGRWVIGFRSINSDKDAFDIKTSTWNFTVGVGIPLFNG